MTIDDRKRHRAIKYWDDANQHDERARASMERAHRDRTNAVRILRAAGLSLRAAGDVLGVSRTTIAKYDTTDES